MRGVAFTIVLTGLLVWDFHANHAAGVEMAYRMAEGFFRQFGLI